MNDHVMNILREVAKEGAVNGKEYLEAKARQIDGLYAPMVEVARIVEEVKEPLVQETKKK